MKAAGRTQQGSPWPRGSCRERGRAWVFWAWVFWPLAWDRRRFLGVGDAGWSLGVANKVAGSGADEGGRSSTTDAPARKSGWSRVWSIAGNVLSVALLGVAVAVFLKRCGIVHF